MPDSLFKNKTALITGGSSGIGFDLAKLFLKDGAKVVLVARDGEKLARAGSELQKEFRCEPVLISKDLSGPNACQEVFNELSSKKVTVDILVNNAGFGMYGKFYEADIEKCLGMMQTNMTALTVLTRLFLPGMVERGFGRVLNVSSIAGFQAVPIETVYAATKAFVTHFSEGISEELEGTGVSVTCLCPGATQTPFFTRGEIFPSKMMERNMLTSQRVAEIGYQALKAKKVLVVTGFRNKISTFFVRFLPRKWVAKIARAVVE